MSCFIARSPVWFIAASFVFRQAWEPGQERNLRSKIKVFALRYRLITDMIKGALDYEGRFDETLKQVEKLKAGLLEISKGI